MNYLPLSVLKVKKVNYKRLNGFEIRRDQTVELAALERLKNPHRLIMGEMLWPL